MNNLSGLFQQLNLDISSADSVGCLYRTGFLDSANLLQLLLLIEGSNPGRILNLEDILSKEITLSLLEDLLNEELKSS